MATRRVKSPTKTSPKSIEKQANELFNELLILNKEKNAVKVDSRLNLSPRGKEKRVENIDKLMAYNQDMFSLVSKINKITNSKPQDYIQVETPIPSKEYVMKAIMKLYGHFATTFPDACFKITPLKVKKALIKNFENNFFPLNLQYLDIYQDGWDTSVGNGFLDDYSTVLTFVFYQLATDEQFVFPEPKNGESPSRYKERVVEELEAEENE
jgi:hypothetical protein